MKKDQVFNILFKAAEGVEQFAHAKIVSVITYKSKIVSFGFNQNKTHPMQKRYGNNDSCIYLHSEIDAIKNSLRHLTVDELASASLYVLRVKKLNRGQPFVSGSARPCNGCMKAIMSFNIKYVYYSENEKNEFSCL
jgi:deoxycytidylate deaminase